MIVILLAVYFQPVWSALSQSGEYEILDSVIKSGGEWLNGGDYSSRGAIGQEISNENPASLAGYVNRLGFYNPPYFAYQKSLGVDFNNTSFRLNLPADSVNMEVFDIYYNSDVGKIPEKSKVEYANAKLSVNNGPISVPLKISEIYPMNEESLYKGILSKPGTISIHSTDQDGDGYVDSSVAKVRVKTLSGYLLDTDSSLWLKAFNDRVSNGSVTFDFRKSGIYAISGQVDDSVKDVYAFPVPFRPNGPMRGNGNGQTGSEEEGITFANVPQDGKIEIYTVDGLLVKKIDIPYGIAESKIKWDTKNSSGQKTASGVYIWRVVSRSNSKTGKLVVIR